MVFATIALTTRWAVTAKNVVRASSKTLNATFGIPTLVNLVIATPSAARTTENAKVERIPPTTSSPEDASAGETSKEEDAIGE